MMGGQENFIKMKAKPIPKELIDKIELRVEDFEITPREKLGFEGYLLKNVLVPYINGKRRGCFKFHKRINCRDARYYIAWKCDEYAFNRVAYIMLNKDDPRVIETQDQDHYDIADNLEVDHDKDIELQKRKFIIKADTKKNLQLLTHSQNLQKQSKKINNFPKYICFDKNYGCWVFMMSKTETNLKTKSKAFSILSHGWEGAYAKAIDACNKITGSNHILDLNEAIPKEFKGMTEREFHDKYAKEYLRERSLRRKKKKQINPDDELDLGLSLA